MSVAELPPPIIQTSAVPHVGDGSRRLTLTLEQAIYLALVALALLTRLWGLDNRALHHDETLHAAYSWRLFNGQGFIHDPLLHGPFLYHFGALIFFLFGDNNYTARLGVALFGSALVGLPYLIRRELGRGAALLASAYLLISPAFLYVGRFIRHDMYGVTFELLVFICVVRYASTLQPRWLYGGATALGLMFANMETFYLYVAIVGSLLALVFLWRVWRPGIAVALLLGLMVVALVFVLPGEPRRAFSGSDEVERAAGKYICPAPDRPFPPDNPILYRPGPLIGLGPLATADNDYALCVRHEPSNNFLLYFIKLSQFFRHPAIVMALGLSLLGAFGFVMLYLQFLRRSRAPGDGVLAAFASLARGWRLPIALAIFVTIETLLFTAFFTNPTGAVSGVTGSLLYWLAQHGVQRGSQPAYYYLVLLAIYEPLALFWSEVGVILVGVLAVRRLARRLRQRGTAPAGGAPIDWSLALPVMLLWWAVATVALYSWAGEKMPWLTIHVALPLVLLGAWALARVLGWWREVVLPPPVAAPTPRDWRVDAEEQPDSAPHARMTLAGPWNDSWLALLIYLGMVGSVVMLSFLLLTIFGKPDGSLRDFAPWVAPLGLILVALITLVTGLLRGARWAIGALALALTLTGALYTIRSAHQLSFRWGDVPREMMIYTQTSPDVARVIARLEQASIRRGGGLDMPLWYDNETVWDWYLRRFSNARQQPPALTTPPGDDVMAVLILQENLDMYPQNLQNLQGFLIQRYPLRWWFPEDQIYRLPPDWRAAPLGDQSPLLMRALRNPIDGRTAAQLWQFLIYRRLPSPIGSTDFVLAVRPELAQEIGLGTGAQTQK